MQNGLCLAQRRFAGRHPCQAQTRLIRAQAAELAGLSVATITARLAEEMGLGDATGVVITDVDPLSDAAAKGLLPGDVIVEAGQAPVRNVTDLEERVEEAREAGRRSILLLVRRAGEPMFVAVAIGE